jgi:hypothetical protein
VEAGETIQISVNSKILLEARDHSEAQIAVAFSISKPDRTPPGDINSTQKTPLSVTQVISLDLQISAAYQFEDDALVLLVTNSDTTEKEFEALRHVIKEEIGLKLAVWNIALYGSLDRFSGSSTKGDQENSSVMNDFRMFASRLSTHWKNSGLTNTDSDYSRWENNNISRQ